MSDPLEICRLKIELLLKEYECSIEAEDSYSNIYLVNDENHIKLDCD